MNQASMWATAARRGAALAPPGPVGPPQELRALVEDLGEAARRAPALVGDITGLSAAARTAAEVPVLIVDRPRWIKANAEVMRGLASALDLPSGRISQRVQAEETGALMAYLSTKVLGQYDPYGVEAGRLLLVAPNVLRIERELDLDARDFRQWVCLHELTHAVQFAAAPWLSTYLRERLDATLVSVAEDDKVSDRSARLVSNLLRHLRQSDDVKVRRLDVAGPVMDALLTDHERDQLSGIVAVMSLLEGHADVVMDAVGPAVLPSVRRIRSSFNQRRAGTNLLDSAVRSLLGVSAKTAQYRNGAEFVRQVVDQVGHEGLNAVWEGPENLPTPDELFDAEAWVVRVHGQTPGT